MADYWVDTALSTGDNDGTSPANAVRGTSAIKTAFELDHDAGTDVWVRRTSAYDEGVVGLDSDISVTSDGTQSSPVRFISWPRAAIPNTTITEGDWTSGATTVDNVVGITCTRKAHQARWTTAPDGCKYFITQIVDSNTFKIDREYVGSTVTGIDGKFQIDEDYYYSIRPAAGISAGWDSDPHDIPTIDFNDEAYQFVVGDGDLYLIFSGFEVIDSLDSVGVWWIRGGACTTIRNCLVKQNSANTEIFYLRFGSCFIIDCVIEGSGSGTAQHGITFEAGMHFLENVAVYNCGGYAFYGAGGGANVELKNVNLGVEVNNAIGEIWMRYGAKFIGKDVKLDGTNGYVVINTSDPCIGVYIENYQKILGSHKAFYPFLGASETIDVTDTNANKKLSDKVLKITPNLNNAFTPNEWKQEIFDAEFELTSGSQEIKFWIFNDLGQTINDTSATDNVYLEAEYVDSYNNDSEYTNIKVYSTEIDIEDAASADDWDSLSVTVNPVITSKVRVKLIVSIYDASDYFLIDPEPVVT